MAITMIDKDNPVPLYHQLSMILLSQIKEQKYHPGDMIPTENELQSLYQLSRTTVRQAISVLVQDGWLTRVKGKGTFVARHKIKQDFANRIESYNDQILREGMLPSTKILELKVVPASGDVAENLKLPVGAAVIHIERLRFADSDPVVIVDTYLPFDKCSYVMDRNLEEESLYSILNSDSKTAVVYIRRTIEAIPADEYDSRKLELQEGAPVHYFKSIGFNSNNEPIEYSFARYRGDRNSFEVVVVSK